jgi:hypothetical protein
MSKRKLDFSNETKGVSEKTVTFKAKDGSTSVSDVTDLLDGSEILQSALGSTVPLSIDIERAVDIHLGLAFLSSFRTPTTVTDVTDSLSDAVQLIHDLRMVGPVPINLCSAIETLCYTLSEAKDFKKYKISVLSAWVRLVDRNNLRMEHSLDGVKRLVSRLSTVELSEEEKEIVGDAALFSGSPSAFVESTPSNPSFATKSLLDPKLFCPKDTKGITFCGRWVSRFVAGEQKINDRVLAVVRVVKTFKETMTKVLSWIHDDAFVEFGSSRGINVWARNSVGMTIVLSDEPPSLWDGYAPTQCCIVFEEDGPVVTRTLSCDSSNRRKVIVGVPSISDSIRFAKDGYAVFDKSFRKFDLNKLERTDPVYALAVPPKGEMSEERFSDLLSREIRLDEDDRLDCMTARRVREAISGFVDDGASNSWVRFSNFAIERARELLRKDAEKCFE